MTTCLECHHPIKRKGAMFCCRPCKETHYTKTKRFNKMSTTAYLSYFGTHVNIIHDPRPEEGMIL